MLKHIPYLIKKECISMLIKVIYEDPKVLAIQQAIQELDTEQFYFLERFLEQERQRRQEAVFEQWQRFLAQTVDYTCIK